MLNAKYCPSVQECRAILQISRGNGNNAVHVGQQLHIDIQPAEGMSDKVYIVSFGIVKCKYSDSPYRTASRLYRTNIMYKARICS